MSIINPSYISIRNNTSPSSSVAIEVTTVDSNKEKCLGDRAQTLRSMRAHRCFFVLLFVTKKQEVESESTESNGV